MSSTWYMALYDVGLASKTWPFWDFNWLRCSAMASYWTIISSNTIQFLKFSTLLLPLMKFCPVLASENIAPNSVVDHFPMGSLLCSGLLSCSKSETLKEGEAHLLYFLAFLQVSNSCTICCLRRVDFCYILFYLDSCLQV